MPAMKTPGVYIVEQDAFPNSIVEVATAIPAFVGHTETADNHNVPLELKPWPISSMAEYQQYFGGPPQPKFTVDPTEDAKLAHFQALSEPDKPASKKAYRLTPVKGSDGGHYGLYWAMRHFFQNGGGRCFVVSVGNYKQDFDPDQFQRGIDELKKEQEPTMLLLPEAVRLPDADTCKDLQQAMLKHCGYEMKNRVAILDIYNGDRPFEQGDPVGNFRNSLGINFLDFASAYYPWLNTSVVGEKEVDYRNVDPSSLDLLSSLIKAELNLPAKPEPGTKSAVLVDAVEQLKVDFTDVVLKDEREKRDALAKKKNDAAAQTAWAPIEAKAKADNKTAEEIAQLRKDFDTAHPAPKSPTEEPLAKFLEALQKELEAKTPKPSEDEVKAKLDQAGSQWLRDNDNPLGSSEALGAAVKAHQDLLHKTLTGMSQVYRTVLTEARRQLNVLPPSSAMAGIYTLVDNTRGVWKAPANVSLNNVISPTVSISAEDQADLNVSTQGKSINAIRSFIGEGVLVWGARTLDGNSLDWRYINVRRTMIMLEESCRLAAKALVFEPNTANTWITIKSMISNFLTSVWKRGGLMGAVPEDAFSVHVGLGETMTPDDVLNGILRVTVLVAMVRPAEFIEITFQQQMPKSG